MRRQIGVTLMAATLVLAGGTTTVTARSDQPRWKEQKRWAAHFDDMGVTGTALIYDERRDRFLVHDRDRAETRFLPASTFKVFNALVTLENGNVRDEHQLLEWDGQERDIADWNRDHSLASGMRFSVVWFYQEMARRTGQQTMQEWIDRVGYGNGDIGGGIDRFWLDGHLRISAVEQVQFLRRLAHGDLPFAERHQDTTRRITLNEDGPDHELYGKTGWVTDVPGRTDLGWYVGWVERGSRHWFFALNIDITDPDHAAKRVPLTRRLLRDVGALPG